MGKRKRLHITRSKVIVTKIAVKSIFVLDQNEITEAKERFVKDLKMIYSSYLAYFEKMIQNKLENRTGPEGKTLDILQSHVNYQAYYKVDDSHEFSHIFYAQLNRFLNAVLINLRNLEQKPQVLVISCISDAFQLLEFAKKDIEKITSCLFAESGIDCQSMLLLLFHEKLVKDKFIQRFMIEDKNLSDETYDFNDLNNNIFTEPACARASPSKKRNRKRKKKEILVISPELDIEVEEFRSRLEKESCSPLKIKLNFPADWIEALKKQLKNR